MTETGVDQLGRTLRILLLEDSALDAQLIEARLEEAGLSFELKRVDSPPELDAALSGCAYDLILSDYHIPGFDGVAALGAAHRACPEVPFLFISGALGEDKAIELLRRGATDYVLKDRLERLVPSIERALREAREKDEHRRAEEARLESERALRTLMGNMPGMAFRCRPVPPWVFDYASPGVVELTGYQPEDFYAGGVTTWSALMHPEDVERVARDADAAFTERRQLTVTYRIRTRAGDEKWVWDRSIGIYADDGTLQTIEGFVSDVTERTRAAQEREKLARLVENSPDFVGYADLDGWPTYINRAGLQMVGLESLEAARGKHLLEFFPAEERAIMERTVIPAVLRDGHWEADTRWRRFDTGEPIPVGFRMFTVTDPRTGQPLALATVTRDITEKKRHEEDERRRGEFEKQLIGIVSHDLRNPLNTISMGAQMLLRDEGLTDRNTKAVRRIVSAAERATRMIHDLLDFTHARLGGGIPVSPVPIDLHAHVTGVLEELQHTHSERELRLEHEGDTHGSWDPDRIAQLVTNLVGNAVKYSPQGSTVTVRTRGERDAVVLEVHNVGQPIAPDLLPHVFEPLSRGTTKIDMQTRSIGLGLYIVESIVRAHNGRVEARSSAEAGTTFVVRLPRV
jgi:PAS domain S-box-containing protein